MDKYICPKCGGKLYLTKEHFYEIQQYIDCKTGKIKKRIHRKYGDNCETLVSLHCERCNFEYMEGDSEYPNFDTLLEQSSNDKICKIYDYDDVFFK